MKEWGLSPSLFFVDELDLREESGHPLTLFIRWLSPYKIVRFR